jgi:hypothetical protein
LQGKGENGRGGRPLSSIRCHSPLVEIALFEICVVFVGTCIMTCRKFETWQEIGGRRACKDLKTNEDQMVRTIIDIEQSYYNILQGAHRQLLKLDHISADGLCKRTSGQCAIIAITYAQLSVKNICL